MSLPMSERLTVLEVKVQTLEKIEADKETRLREIERRINIWCGALFILNVVLRFLPMGK